MGEPQLGLARKPKPAPLVEVLREQLEYLLAHSPQVEACWRDCPECERYRAVKELLMKPFRQA